MTNGIDITPRDNTSSTAILRRIARGMAAIVLLAGGLTLVGQAPEITVQSNPIPEFGTVSATLTLLVLLAGLSLWLWVGPSASHQRRYARVCAALVAVAGALALGTDVQTGGGLWPQGRLANTFDTVRLLFGGPLPANAALNFVVLGSALLLLDFETSNGRRPSQLLALMAILTSLVAMIGYAYGIAPLYRVAGSPPLPFAAALGFGAMGVGIFLASPECGLTRLVGSDSAGGYVIRFLPVALVAGPLVFGWLTLRLQRANVWDASLTLSIFVMLNTTLVALVIVAVADSLDRAHTRRRLAEQALRTKASHQASLATLGERALSGLDVGRLLSDAAKLVAETLQVDFCEVWAHGREQTLVLRGTVGWTDDDSHVIAEDRPHSVADYTLACEAPVVVEDFGRDTRFPKPLPQRLQALVSGTSVVIQRSRMSPLGVLAVYTRRSRSFTSDDIHFLRMAAALLGSAIDRSRAAAALTRSEEKFAQVFRFCPDSISLSTVPEGRFIDVNASFLRRTGHTKDAIVGRTASELRLWRPADHERLIEQARKGDVEVGVEASFRTNAGELRTSLCFTELLTVGDDECLLTLARDISDRKRVEAMAEEANRELRRSVTELERQTREISLFNDMSDLLHSCVTPTEASAIVVQFAQQLFPDDAGALCLLSEAHQLVEATGTWGSLAREDCVFRPIDCWALRQGRPHVVSDPLSGLVCPHLTGPRPLSYVCVPMMAQNETLGLLHVRQRLGVRNAENGPIPAPGVNRRLAVTLAEHVALAMANLKLRETLRSQSIRDQLTGLLNRRYMEESLEREIGRAARSKSSLGLVLLDVDRFKDVNDMFGHEAGDRLLRIVSQFLHARTKEDDILCRLGGDEFVLVMPGATLAAVRERAEQFLGEIKGVATRFSSRDDYVLSLSMGIAVFPAHGATGKSLLRAADVALYRAKAEGRAQLAIGQAVE